MQSLKAKPEIVVIDVAHQTSGPTTISYGSDSPIKLYERIGTTGPFVKVNLQQRVGGSSFETKGEFTTFQLPGSIYMAGIVRKERPGPDEAGFEIFDEEVLVAFLSKQGKSNLFVEVGPTIGGTFFEVRLQTIVEASHLLQVGDLNPLSDPDGIPEFLTIRGGSVGLKRDIVRDLTISHLLPGNSMDSRLLAVTQDGKWDVRSGPIQTLKRKVEIQFNKLLITNLDEVDPGQVTLWISVYEGHHPPKNLGEFNWPEHEVRQGQSYDLSPWSFNVVSGPKSVDEDTQEIWFNINAREADWPDPDDWSRSGDRNVFFDHGPHEVMSDSLLIPCDEPGSGDFRVNVGCEISVTYS